MKLIQKSKYILPLERCLSHLVAPLDSSRQACSLDNEVYHSLRLCDRGAVAAITKLNRRALGIFCEHPLKVSRNRLILFANEIGT